MAKLKINLTSLLLGLLILLILFANIFFTVGQSQYGIVLQFGEIRRVIDSPGLYVKIPLIQNVRYFDRRILTLESTQAETYLTAEKKPVLVNSFVKWKITDPTLFYRSFGGDERRANARMSQIVNSDLREAFGRRTVQNVVSGERDKVMAAVQASADAAGRQVGISVVDVRLKRVDLPDSVSQSVFERMKAERRRVANELRSEGAAVSEKIRAEADKEAQIIVANAYRDAQRIKGQGDAKAALIYANSFQANPEFYAFYRSLLAYEKSFQGTNDVLVLDPSTSAFFRYMRQLERR